jgi:hypothetical protein
MDTPRIGTCEFRASEATDNLLNNKKLIGTFRIFLNVGNLSV